MLAILDTVAADWSKRPILGSAASLAALQRGVAIGEIPFSGIGCASRPTLSCASSATSEIYSRCCEKISQHLAAVSVKLARMNVPRPSLNALRAFEAAARLGSITAAAKELGVSHGAISHHIASIEMLFGIPLLRRLPHSVQPSGDGARLAGRLTEGFRLINSGVKLLQPAPLQISCSSTMMMHWLIPRLASFKEAYLGVEIRLNVNYGLIDFVKDEISVAIRLDKIRPPKEAIVEFLIPEEIGPVCSPAYLAHNPIATPAALKGVRLLTPATRPSAWQDWWAAIRQPGNHVQPNETYEHFYLQNQAAACGLGVGLSPRILVADQIAAGRLVAPLGFVSGPYNLVLWIASHLRLRSDLRTLVAWLSANIKNSRIQERNAVSREVA